MVSPKHKKSIIVETSKTSKSFLFFVRCKIIHLIVGLIEKKILTYLPIFKIVSPVRVNKLFFKDVPNYSFCYSLHHQISLIIPQWYPLVLKSMMSQTFYWGPLQQRKPPPFPQQRCIHQQQVVSRRFLQPAQQFKHCLQVLSR